MSYKDLLLTAERIMSNPAVKEDRPLSGLEWSALGVLSSELTLLKIKKQPSNEEQVVIDWMQARIDSFNARRKRD
jgi:hypothetical protein